METGAAVAAASGGFVRLDPYALPAQFCAEDATADGRTRQIEIDHDRVVLRRSVAGIAMRVALPIRSYLGVGLAGARDSEAMAIILAHRDPGLSVVLSTSSDDDIVADWRAWSDRLGCPLLVTETDGGWKTATTWLGMVAVEAPSPRRRRHSAHARRRPKALMRRKAGGRGSMPVHRDEREIIART